MKVNSFPNRILKTENEKYLYFGGTAYLGLPTNKKFQKILISNILQWGTAYGSSRSANVKLTAYEKGEKFLARFIKAEATITVSSGMLAGKITIDVLQSQTDQFFHYPNIHTAIKSANSIPFFVQNEMNPRLLDNLKERITILTDAVPSFNTEPIDLSFLNFIPANKEITLVLDESHSLGILGTNGCGIFSSIAYPNVKRKIMLSSLGKAFGLTGGVIVSDAEFIQQIRKNDSFVSSAGMNPAFVQTIADAEIIYIKQHQKLKDNLAYLKKNLKENKTFNFNGDYPLIYLENDAINPILIENKIIIANFKYASEIKDLNRIVITANHKKEDLDKIIGVLNQF
ncbi:aminotransferase class I/II-fold pyridoxal phosphate-dependent enzyme [Flavobacterium sp. WC2430]|uniref:aminotransferase class I/II-fold pyridoxal phosphate-dependent enzyme n=1 Tax=Flavobacterium sp. WC2430 TaxID=3234137 RepID=UPI0034654B8B